MGKHFSAFSTYYREHCGLQVTKMVLFFFFLLLVVVVVVVVVVGLGIRPRLKIKEEMFDLEEEKREGGHTLAGVQAPPGISRYK